ALVRATVLHGFDVAVFLSHDDQWLTGDVIGQEITGVRNLAVVADIIPGVGEIVFLFQLEQFLIDVQIAMHLFRLHQRPYSVRVLAIGIHTVTLLGMACVHSCRMSGYRSRTSLSPLARDTQICITSPLSFSDWVRT